MAPRHGRLVGPEMTNALCDTLRSGRPSVTVVLSLQDRRSAVRQARSWPRVLHSLTCEKPDGIRRLYGSESEGGCNGASYSHLRARSHVPAVRYHSLRADVRRGPDGVSGESSHHLTRVR